MTERIELHPIVAALAAGIVQDASGLHFETGALERARAELKHADDGVLVHVVALGIRTQRIAGPGARAILVDLATLVAERLGSGAAAAERFEAAGLDATTAALIGASNSRLAPGEKPASNPTAKPKRGLSSRSS